MLETIWTFALITENAFKTESNLFRLPWKPTFTWLLAIRSILKESFTYNKNDNSLRLDKNAYFLLSL